MTFVRMPRKDRTKDLRNDPIDAVHHSLADTFCRAIATGDRGIRRIHDVVPEPQCSLFWVRGTVVAAHVERFYRSQTTGRR